MKDAHIQIENMGALKATFLLVIILAALGLELTGIYTLYKEHLYYIILLFLWADLIYGVAGAIATGHGLFNLGNIIVAGLIVVTTYLAYSTQQKHVESFDSNRTKGTGTTAEQETALRGRLGAESHETKKEEQMQEVNQPPVPVTPPVTVTGQQASGQQAGLEGYSTADDMYASF